MVAFQLTEELKNYMRHLMTLTTNADTAYRIAKEEMGMTRAEVRWAWRETARSELYRTLLNTWGKERKPPVSWGTKAYFEMREPYMYIFNLTIKDLQKGDFIQQNFVYYHDKLESFLDVWNQLEGVKDRYAPAPFYELLSWRPAGLWVR